MVKAVRGAVQVEADERGLITSEIKKMIEEIVSSNKIEVPDIVSILFTVTGDLKSVNPAAALRAGGDFADTPLFCAQEPETAGALPMMIRVLMTCENCDNEQVIKHVYTGGAEKLRPDLS